MKQEIVEIRKLMQEEGMDVYYIPSGDFHSSEYVNDYFKAREFMSNLTGEAGDMLVTEDGAWLWTDGRYFLQAETQLAGTGVELMRMAEPGVPTIEEFLTELVKKANDAGRAYVIGFDGRVVPAAFGLELEEHRIDELHDVIASHQWEQRVEPEHEPDAPDFPRMTGDVDVAGIVLPEIAVGDHGHPVSQLP